MKILLMGPQGCGKGTVGRILSEKMGIPLISNGEVLRSLPVSHPRYQEINDRMSKGELVPQDFLAQLLKETTSKPECAKGYILDGWGRKDLDLKLFDPIFDHVIFINISPETSVHRISGRRVCPVDNTAFNIYTLPPKVENICDVCGAELTHRNDDKEEVVMRRWEIFNTDTAKVLQIFREQGKLIEVDGEPAPDVIAQNILAKISV